MNRRMQLNRSEKRGHASTKHSPTLANTPLKAGWHYSRSSVVFSNLEPPGLPTVRGGGLMLPL
eukprot:2247967-Pleurochrysis_carterae.AAC.1